MPCPTCSHTMHHLGNAMAHCPRCGTLTGCYADGAAFVPALVKRCRGFARRFRVDEDADLMTAWGVLGIAESIAAEDERRE